MKIFRSHAQRHRAAREAAPESVPVQPGFLDPGHRNANRIQVTQHRQRKVAFTQDEFMTLLGLAGERTFYVSTAGTNVEVYLSDNR